MLLGLTSLLVLLFSSHSFALANDEIEKRFEVITEEIELLKASQLMETSQERVTGLGYSASKIYKIKKGVSIGAYGEITYKDPSNKDESGTTNIKGTPEAEVLRNIIYLGYKFNDQWLVNAEIEIEHVDKVFAEFIYLEYIHSQKLRFRSGLLLVPMGYVNEGHEPVLFPSVDRPDIERYIIPSTWREIGLGLIGEINNLSYKLYLINGFDGQDLDSSGSANSILRDARRKGGNSGNEDASDFAWVGRLDYQINSKLTTGLSYYTGEASGGNPNSSGRVSDVGINMYDLHAELNTHGFRGRFVYANFNTNDAAKFNTESSRKLPEQMSGYYIEILYDLFKKKQDKKLMPFLRYEDYNLNKKMPSGSSPSLAAKRTNTTVGIAYQPTAGIIFKADYSMLKNDAKSGVDEFHLGAGYNF